MAWRYSTFFYTLPAFGDSYDDALKALKHFFVPKLNVVTERNKFRQLVGHKLTDLRLSMQRLCRTCDQIVEKTSKLL